jgi:hypothetical protein
MSPAPSKPANAFFPMQWAGKTELRQNDVLPMMDPMPE